MNQTVNASVRVYVGTDQSQQLAVKVLEYSIKKRTKLPVEVYSMVNLSYALPKDPRQGQRTGFSFSRFCIPALAGYHGKAIYMDADMIVFKDISSLWNHKFLPKSKIVIQKDLEEDEATNTKKIGAPPKRIRQCAVMVIDCEKTHWKIEDIVQGLDDKKYDYAKLMYELCILEDNEIQTTLPFEWNSLEMWNENTCLLHYTDMGTQPWTSCFNKLGYLWFNEVREMLKKGVLTKEEIVREIDLGYFRPSLIRDVLYRHTIPRFLHGPWDKFNAFMDRLAGYKQHKAVYEAKRQRECLIKQYELSLKQQ